jgi:excisionase family DNA binding protein
MNERLMTPNELADFLGIPVGTIYQWRVRGLGPRAVRVGRHIRFRRPDVEQWVDSQTETA